MSLPAFLGLAYFASELLLALTRRSRGAGVKRDRGTLHVLWVVILLSIVAGLFVGTRWSAAALPKPNICRLVGIGLFVAGLALRWWAIVALGRFFTVDVQIAPDHHLVESGPFRFLRHPSYSGVLLAFLGFSLTLCNWAALLVIMAPITAAFVHRMNVEEGALQAALGQKYRDYLIRTKRLIPGIY
ncbi:MAG: protein-S-isoprenylcysteine methyltransferase [Chthoniobacterales bacterium]|nr:MAG: protein-S-isoprenylcysteine methyltransferase [Chthoniobacterales bacterium]